MIKTTVDFNFGLGFFPVSQFLQMGVGLEDSSPIKILDEMYSKISMYKDIILYGNIVSQWEMLKYFYLLLEKSGFLISTFIKYEELNSKLLSEMVGYLILYMKDQQIVNFFKAPNMLNKGDKIIVDTEDIKLLRFLNKTIVNQKLEFKPMFLNKGEEFLKEIIKNEIYGLIPINKEFLKERFEV
uniref:Uncharacterized protein n=1 Tax=viral metagenome TaxID=1070528 RepID=A0A6M3XXP0_9ZZZZ